MFEHPAMASTCAYPVIIKVNVDIESHDQLTGISSTSLTTLGRS